MCFNLVTFKKVLTLTLLLITLCVFSFTIFAPEGMADTGQISPPPPTVADTTDVYATDSSNDPEPGEEQLSTWEMLLVVVANMI